MKKWSLLFLVVILLWWVSSGYAGEKRAECPNFSSFYCKSLHFTGNGMRYWYERDDGFIKITGIPYDKLMCKKCHATSCDKCHARGDKTKYFSLSKAKDMNTCMSCHGREKLGFILDKKALKLGIHVSSGMGCMDCHVAKEIHGTGVLYNSMRDKGVIQISCLGCHKGGENAPEFNEKLRSHRVHKGKLDCAACHVSASISCYNCHFGQFLKTGKKKGNFIPMKSWLLLVNYNGKVTSGTVMSLVYKKKKFIGYAPFFTHSVMSKGRSCSDCHANRAMKLIKEGKNIPVVEYKDGKVTPWKGVIPCVPDRLRWLYLDKKDGKWVPLEDGTKEFVRFADYGSPLTEKQLKKLMMPYGKKR